MHEKQNLREVDSFVVLEYIRNSFDILLNMKMEENKHFENFKFKELKQNSNDPSARTAESQFCSESDANDYE